MSVETLWPKVEAYLQELAQLRQASEHTVSNYQRDLRQLVLYLEQESDVDQWASLNRQHLRHYLVYRHQKGMAPRSLQRQLSCIRAFLFFLQQQDIITDNPADGLKAPKSGQLLPKPVDIDQLHHALDHVADKQDDVAVRDKAMLELLYATGIRLAELVSLNLDQVDFSQRQVRVLGKGNKERLVPFGAKAEEALRAWLKVRPSWLQQIDGYASSENTALFLGVRGKRINRGTVQQRLAEIGVEQGIQDRLHPHRLRHSFASHLLESSGDLRAVQELMGHADISSTQIYTRLDYQHLAQVYDKAHPRAKRKQQG